MTSVNNQSLHLVILPTEKCNFRCTYCYEDFAIGRMPRRVIDSVKTFVRRRIPELQALDIEWFGGEPLLAKNVIWEISEAIQEAVTGSLHETAYRGGITTNGWGLDVGTAETLVKHGIRRAQVSLDGPREFHDSTRRKINGSGSYDRLHANLKSIRDAAVPIQVLLRVHLTPDNAAAMPTFVDWLGDTYLTDARFALLLTRVAHLGGANDGNFEILNDSEAAEIITTLHMAGSSKAVSTKADRVDLFESQEALSGIDVCYAAKMNSLVIRADGHIAKCTVALSQPGNDVGMLNDDGSLSIDNGRLRLWTNGWFSGDVKQLACPYEANPNVFAAPANERRLLPLSVV